MYLSAASTNSQIHSIDCKIKIHKFKFNANFKNSY